MDDLSTFLHLTFLLAIIPFFVKIIVTDFPHGTCSIAKMGNTLMDFIQLDEIIEVLKRSSGEGDLSF